MKEMRICSVCKKPIENPRAKYHPECRSKRAPRVLFTCPICGTVKEVLASKAKHMKYCSDNCKYKICNKKEHTFNIPKEEIERLYFDEKKSVQEIAEVYHTTKTTIFKKFKLHGIKTRSVSEGRSVFLTEHPDENPFKREDVKEKIRPHLSKPENIAKRLKGIQKYFIELPLTEREEWIQNIKTGMQNMTDEQKHHAMIRQMETKRRNGTLNCTGIEDRFAKILDKHNIQYEREFIVPEGNRRYRYDFRIGKLLYEIQGTHTHADRRVYGPDDIIETGLKGWKKRPAKEIWEEDRKKKEYAEGFGYQVHQKWEKDIK
jgi:predicted DNA-binding protein YlxM (UPF0122 family)